jgi:hypothetical protein
LYTNKLFIKLFQEKYTTQVKISATKKLIQENKVENQLQIIKKEMNLCPEFAMQK